ncbi:hypothetical protein Fmac_008427 [Flemingia macrophylla]|uniref:Uncharacterized protein n=1 Tax=Flemingia macrophylla TaxID=520843 RepID=A0ABD1MY84_9FABA
MYLQKALRSLYQVKGSLWTFLRPMGLSRAHMPLPNLPLVCAPSNYRPPLLPSTRSAAHYYCSSWDADRPLQKSPLLQVPTGRLLGTLSHRTGFKSLLLKSGLPTDLKKHTLSPSLRTPPLIFSSTLEHPLLIFSSSLTNPSPLSFFISSPPSPQTHPPRPPHRLPPPHPAPPSRLPPTHPTPLRPLTTPPHLATSPVTPSLPPQRPLLPSSHPRDPFSLPLPNPPATIPFSCSPSPSTFQQPPSRRSDVRRPWNTLSVAIHSGGARLGACEPILIIPISLSWVGIYGYVAYSTTKFGLRGLAKAFRV